MAQFINMIDNIFFIMKKLRKQKKIIRFLYFPSFKKLIRNISFALISFQYSLLQFVVEACQKKSHCKFTASARTNNDPCPETTKFVEVAYKCRPCKYIYHQNISNSIHTINKVRNIFFLWVDVDRQHAALPTFEHAKKHNRQRKKNLDEGKKDWRENMIYIIHTHHENRYKSVH